MTERPFRDAARSHDSLTARVEKAILIWLAQRTPPWINSDHLTALGLLSMLGAGLSYWYAATHPIALLAVIGFLALNWLGDSLDGTLARVRNRLRPRYGFYVDHIVDALGAGFLFGGMALSGFMSSTVAACLLIAYLVLMIDVFLATYTLGTFEISFWKLGPTELRILLAVGNIALYVRGPFACLGSARFLLFDVGGVIGAASLTLVLLVSVIRHTRALYRLETLP
jgi:archaetidylinositol phosphate synthase